MTLQFLELRIRWHSIEKQMKGLIGSDKDHYLLYSGNVDPKGLLLSLNQLKDSKLLFFIHYLSTSFKIANSRTTDVRHFCLLNGVKVYIQAFFPYFRLVPNAELSASSWPHVLENNEKNLQVRRCKRL